MGLTTIYKIYPAVCPVGGHKMDIGVMVDTTKEGSFPVVRYCPFCDQTHTFQINHEPVNIVQDNEPPKSPAGIIHKIARWNEQTFQANLHKE